MILMPDFYTDLLTVNPYSRVGRKLLGVKIVAVHFFGSKRVGMTAKNCRDYFESLKNGKTVFGSAQICVDEKDSIIAVPLDEVAYAVGKTPDYPYTAKKEAFFGNLAPNDWSISIEMAHNPDGSFADATLIRAARWCAYLCAKHRLDPMERVWRHGDVCEKDCPSWFMSHPTDFEAFKHLVEGMV